MNNSKTKAIIRKAIYFVLFAFLFVCFIFLGNKYENNRKPVAKNFSDYYEKIETDRFEVVSGSKVNKLISEGKNIIFIGNSKKEWSQYYAMYLNQIISSFDDVKVYYYDLDNDKTLLSPNYYDIIEKLDGFLVTTDNSNSGLYAPSLYIVRDGKVLYYNVETVAMKNTDSVEDYWTLGREQEFKYDIKEAINKYYLNNK